MTKVKIYLLSSFFLAIFLTGVYMFQIVSLNAKTYLISTSQNKIQRLQQTNNNLEIQTSLNTQSNLDKIAKNLAFEKIKKVDYINLFQGVAER